jgi:hypothetical protein
MLAPLVGTSVGVMSRIQLLRFLVLSGNICFLCRWVFDLRSVQVGNHAEFSGKVLLLVPSGYHHRWRVCLALGSAVSVLARTWLPSWGCQMRFAVRLCIRISRCFLSIAVEARNGLRSCWYRDRYDSICKNDTSSSRVFGGVHSCTAHNHLAFGE